jgi:hypothetical protein
MGIGDPSSPGIGDTESTGGTGDTERIGGGVTVSSQ